MVLPDDAEAATSVIVAPGALPPTLLQQAVLAGNTELARDLIALEREWRKDRAREAFDEAISAAKAEIPPIIKNRQAHNSKYADFAAIAKVVDPIIATYGLSYRFRTRQDDRIHVTCVLSHRAGHSEENSLSGPPDTNKGMNPVQAIGSTLTYLQRYTLVQALGLAVSNDDDGQASGRGEPVSEEQAKNLRAAIISTNSSESKFVKLANVDRIEDLAASRYANAMMAIKNGKFVTAS